MSLTRYSELTLIVAVVAAVLTAGVAGAVSVTDESVPEEAEVGSDVTASVELQDLYEDDAQWELGATTGLQDANWTVELYSDGELVDEASEEGDMLPAFELDENASEAPDTVVIEVEGVVPEISQYSYEEGDTTVAIELLGHDGTGQFTVDSWSVDRYTTGDPGSREARTALDDARASIDQASEDGHDVSDAETRFTDAVTFYNDGTFEDAVAAADDAVEQIDESGSDGAGSSEDDADAEDGEAADSETSDDADAGEDDSGSDDSDSDDGSGLLTLFLYLLGFVALIAVVGGVLYFRQQQQSPNRDPLG